MDSPTAAWGPEIGWTVPISNTFSAAPTSETPVNPNMTRKAGKKRHKTTTLFFLGLIIFFSSSPVTCFYPATSQCFNKALTPSPLLLHFYNQLIDAKSPVLCARLES
jgi:hypothetical protein